MYVANSRADTAGKILISPDRACNAKAFGGKQDALAVCLIRFFRRASCRHSSVDGCNAVNRIDKRINLPCGKTITGHAGLEADSRQIQSTARRRERAGCNRPKHGRPGGHLSPLCNQNRLRFGGSQRKTDGASGGGGFKPRGVDVIAAQIQHQPRCKTRVLLSVGLVDRFAHQSLTIGIGIDEQPLNMGGLQGFTAAGLIIRNGLRQDFVQVVRNRLNLVPIEFAQIHAACSNLMSVL